MQPSAPSTAIQIDGPQSPEDDGEEPEAVGNTPPESVGPRDI